MFPTHICHCPDCHKYFPVASKPEYLEKEAVAALILAGRATLYDSKYVLCDSCGATKSARNRIGVPR